MGEVGVTEPAWETIRRLLATLPATNRESGGLRRAAVLVPLYKVGDELFMLLTKRTQVVEHHKGQISFPGGAAEADEDLLETALRETHEELGIPASEVQVLGTLPEVDVTVSGFLVRPFVGVIPHPYPLRLNADEIDELVLMPLAALRDPAALRVERRQRDGKVYDVFVYEHGGQTVWGATARIIKHLVDRLAGPIGGTAGG